MGCPKRHRLSMYGVAIHRLDSAIGGSQVKVKYAFSKGSLMLLSLATGLGVAFILGMGVLSFLRPKALLENAILSPTIGLGLVAYFMFLQNSVLHIPYTPMSAKILTLMLLAFSVALIYTKRHSLSVSIKRAGESIGANLSISQMAALALLSHSHIL
jgi:hypothetical protein